MMAKNNDHGIKMPRNKIQLALQGGGAKISALLAVAEAVQQLQTDQTIQVQRIAGTSAGAIVGAFLAAGVNIAKVRESLIQGGGKVLVDAFPMPSWPVIAAKFTTGDPFWSTDALEKWLQQIFNGVGVKYIGDCKRTGELRIMAANLSTSKMKTFTDSDELIPALLASAGLPICFRTWKTTDANGDLIIDGGIGENLPIEQLSNEVSQYGELVAVTFKTVVPNPPTNGIKYALSVIGTAIDISVERACSRVPKNRLFPFL